jgi:hypothetical protein
MFGEVAVVFPWDCREVVEGETVKTILTKYHQTTTVGNYEY